MLDSLIYDIKTKEDLILDYRPNEPVKGINNSSDESLIETEENTNYSSMIKNIDSHRPSFVLNGFSILTETAAAFIGDIDSRLKSDTMYDVYKNNNFSEYYNDINTNTGFEVLDELKRSSDEVKSIMTLYKDINYGEDSEMDSIDKTDDENINKLKALEDSENSNLINYYSLYIDSQVNLLMLYYIKYMTGYINNVTALLNTEDTKTSDISKDTLLELFNNSCTQGTSSSNKISEITNKEIIQNSIKSVYEKKLKVNKLILESNSIKDKDETLKGSLNSLLDDKYFNLLTSIRELSKSLNLNLLYKNDYYKSIKNKKSIREAYNLLDVTV